MREKISILYRDRFLLYTNILTTTFLAVTTIFVLLFIDKLPPLIPVFNSMPWGMRRLYSSEIVIFFPLILLFLILVNALVATLIYKKYTLLARFLSFNSFLFCFLGCLAYLQILFLVY